MQVIWLIKNGGVAGKDHINLNIKTLPPRLEQTLSNLSKFNDLPECQPGVAILVARTWRDPKNRSKSLLLLWRK